MTRVWAGFAAAALFVAACAPPAGPLPSASRPIPPTGSPGASTPTDGEASLPPVAITWEVVVDDPAWLAAGIAGLSDLVAGGPGVVALGQVDFPDGSGRVVALSSPDGRSWAPVPVDLGWQGGGRLASGSGGIVAAGHIEDPSRVRFDAWHSDDGDIWEHGVAPSDASVRETALIADGAGFLGVGCDASRSLCLGLVVLTSDDGRAFVRQPAVPESTAAMALGVASGDPGYLAWASDCIDACAGEHVLTWLSEDGTSWQRSTGGPSPDAELVRLAALSDWETGFVAVGAVGSVDRRTGVEPPGPATWSSPDGQDWQRTAGGRTFEGGTLRTVLHVGDHLIAAGSVPDGDFSRAALWVSGDGASWRRVPDDPAFDRGSIEKLAIGPVGLVAIGAIGREPSLKPAVWVGPIP